MDQNRSGRAMVKEAWGRVTGCVSEPMPLRHSARPLYRASVQLRVDGGCTVAVGPSLIVATDDLRVFLSCVRPACLSLLSLHTRRARRMTRRRRRRCTIGRAPAAAVLARCYAEAPDMTASLDSFLSLYIASVSHAVTRAHTHMRTYVCIQCALVLSVYALPPSRRT